MNRLDEIRARLDAVSDAATEELRKDAQRLLHIWSMPYLRYLLSELKAMTTDRDAWRLRAEKAESQLRDNAVFMAVHGAGGYTLEPSAPITIDPVAQHFPCITCAKNPATCKPEECERLKRYDAAREATP